MVPTRPSDDVQCRAAVLSLPRVTLSSALWIVGQPGVTCLPMGCNMKHLTILSCKLAWTFQKEKIKSGRLQWMKRIRKNNSKVMFKLV